MLSAQPCRARDQWRPRASLFGKFCFHERDTNWIGGIRVGWFLEMKRTETRSSPWVELFKKYIYIYIFSSFLGRDVYAKVGNCVSIFFFFCRENFWSKIKSRNLFVNDNETKIKYIEKTGNCGKTRVTPTRIIIFLTSTRDLYNYVTRLNYIVSGMRIKNFTPTS